VTHIYIAAACVNANVWFSVGGIWQGALWLVFAALLLLAKRQGDRK
jgi:hypothetical protein